jgi:hypothetical protein
MKNHFRNYLTLIFILFSFSVSAQRMYLNDSAIFYTHDLFIVGVDEPSLTTPNQIAQHYKLTLDLLLFKQSYQEMTIIEYENTPIQFDTTYRTIVEYRKCFDSLADKPLKKGDTIVLPPYVMLSSQELLSMKECYQKFSKQFPEIVLKKGDTLSFPTFDKDWKRITYPPLSKNTKLALKHRKKDYPYSVYVRDNDESFKIQLPDLSKDIRAIGKIKLNQDLTAYLIMYDANEESSWDFWVYYLYVFNEEGKMIGDPILISFGAMGGSGKPYGLDGKIFYSNDNFIIFLKYSYDDRYYYSDKTGCCYFRKEIFIFNYYYDEHYKLELDVESPISLFKRMHLSTVYQCEYEDIQKID